MIKNYQTGDLVHIYHKTKLNYVNEYAVILTCEKLYFDQCLLNCFLLNGGVKEIYHSLYDFYHVDIIAKVA